MTALLILPTKAENSRKTTSKSAGCLVTVHVVTCNRLVIPIGIFPPLNRRCAKSWLSLVCFGFCLQSCLFGSVQQCFPSFFQHQAKVSLIFKTKLTRVCSVIFGSLHVVNLCLHQLAFKKVRAPHLLPFWKFFLSCFLELKQVLFQRRQNQTYNLSPCDKGIYEENIILKSSIMKRVVRTPE